jgi:hypothetical protein
VSRNSPQTASPQPEELAIFLTPEEDFQSSSNWNESLLVNERDDEVAEEGTGALVYDNSDYEDLMRALDASLSISSNKNTAKRRGGS